MTEFTGRSLTQGEQIAQQTLIAFSESETQEPIDTFLPDSEVQIDLSQYHPGTIFRIAHLDKTSIDNDPRYIWYVLGDRVKLDEGEEVLVHDVSVPLQRVTEQRLSKTDRATIYDSSRVRIRPFSVRDAKLVLEGQELVPEGELYRDSFPVTRVDVMALGVDLGNTQPLTTTPDSRFRLN